MPDTPRINDEQRAAPDSIRPHDTITRSFLPLGAGEAVARLIAFMATLVLARRLGAEGLGVVSFAAAVLLYLSRIVDAGFDLGIGVREAAARRGTIAEFIQAALAFRLALALVVIAIASTAAMLFLPSPENRVVALYTVTVIPLALSARWVLTGFDRTAVSGMARATGELVVLISVALAIHSAGDLERMPIAQFVGDSMAAIVVFFGLRRIGVKVGVRWRGDLIRPLLPNIAPYVGSTLLGIVAFNADVLFLRAFGDATTVGLYSSAYALVSFVLNIGGMYGLSLLPSLIRLDDDTATRQSVYDQAVGKAFIVVLPIAVGGGMISAAIMQVVYGAEFVTAGPVLALLLVSVPLSVLRSIVTSGIMAARREGFLLRTVAVSAIANVILNLLVVPRWGMMGAAAVTVATEALRLVVAIHYAGRVGFAVPPLRLLLKPAIAAAIMALVLLSPAGRSPWLAIPAGALAYGSVLIALGAMRLRKGLPELIA